MKCYAILSENKIRYETGVALRTDGDSRADVDEDGIPDGDGSYGQIEGELNLNWIYERQEEMKAASGSIFNFARNRGSSGSSKSSSKSSSGKSTSKSSTSKSTSKGSTSTAKGSTSKGTTKSNTASRTKSGGLISAIKDKVSSAVTKVKTTVKQTVKKITKNAQTKAKKQYEKKTHTEKIGTSGNPRKKMSSSVKKAAKETFDIHPILDAVGFVPVLGEPADFVNGLIYASEEDYINAGLSMAAVIPVIREKRDKAVIQGIIKDLSGREEKPQEEGR